MNFLVGLVSAMPVVGLAVAPAVIVLALFIIADVCIEPGFSRNSTPLQGASGEQSQSW